MWKILAILFLVFAIIFIACFFLLKDSNKLLAFSSLISILISAFAFAYDVFTITTPPTPLESTASLETTDEVWKKIESLIILDDYDGVIELAKEHHLLEEEEMLNIQGIMYSNGFFYEQDFEKAIKYFKAASVFGSDKSYSNWFLAAYTYDRTNSVEDSTLNFKETFDLIKYAESNNNLFINQILTDAIFYINDTAISNAYEYWHKLNYDDKNQLLSKFVIKYDSIPYLHCLDYKYYTIDNEQIVKISKLQERYIPINIYQSFMPYSSYCLFDSIYINVPVAGEYEIGTTFEYNPEYVDEFGNVCFWEDTDELYYGDNAPEDTDDYRWVIYDHSKENSERIFRKQIKE